MRRMNSKDDTSELEPECEWRFEEPGLIVLVHAVSVQEVDVVYCRVGDENVEERLSG